MTISEKISRFMLTTRFEEIPREVVEHAKLLLIDTIGVAMTSRNQVHAQIIEDMVKASGSLPEATLWGSNVKVQVSDALLYNSALIHGIDYDDTHVAGIVHPSASVAATAITLGEKLGSTPKEILTAIILGWEVIVGLAVAAKGRFHDIGYHASGLLSPFASACVAARLLGESENTLCNALGICGSQAASLQEFLHDGSWTKKMHPGWGCHSAYYAIQMAKRGFKGPSKVFEGEFGLYKTHTGTTDGLDACINSLSTVWRSLEITFKLYPVCHFTHSFIDAIIALKKEFALEPENIEKITCRIDSRGYSIICNPIEKKKHPDSDYMMRFSLPYVSAIAMLKGRLSPWDIDIGMAEDEEVIAMMQRVECVIDDSVKNEGHFPGYIEIYTTDGLRYTLHIPYEKGSTGNPILPADVFEKFYNNLSRLYPVAVIEDIKDKIEGFDSMKDIDCLLRKLSL